MGRLLLIGAALVFLVLLIKAGFDKIEANGKKKKNGRRKDGSSFL
jgi:hypothetical protein